MKLAQLQEARYAYPNYAQWVLDQFDKGYPVDDEITTTEPAQQVLKQLKREFGQPTFDEEGYEWAWTTRENGDMITHQILYWADDDKLIAAKYWAAKE